MAKASIANIYRILIKPLISAVFLFLGVTAFGILKVMDGFIGKKSIMMS
jgi:hypothetical protein